MPQPGAGNQEPLMRVVAEDLDKVNVVPYVSGDALSRSKRQGELEHESRSMEVRRNSPAKKRHNPSHRRHDPYQGDGHPEMTNMPRGTFTGPQTMPPFPGSEGRVPRTSMPRRTQRIQRRNSKDPSGMSTGACREALGKARYCEGLLRRAGMCQAQQRHRDSVTRSQSCRRSHNRYTHSDHMDRRRFNDYRNRRAASRNRGARPYSMIDRPGRRSAMVRRRGVKQANKLSPTIDG